MGLTYVEQSVVHNLCYMYKGYAFLLLVIVAVVTTEVKIHIILVDSFHHRWEIKNMKDAVWKPARF